MYDASVVVLVAHVEIIGNKTELVLNDVQVNIYREVGVVDSWSLVRDRVLLLLLFLYQREEKLKLWRARLAEYILSGGDKF